MNLLTALLIACVVGVIARHFFKRKRPLSKEAWRRGERDE